MKNSRLAPANARDGVDTRKKGNWASVATQPQKTICRSDTIIGLGNPAVTNWGDMMTGLHCNSRPREPIARTEPSAIALYRDMADEPWKYGDEDMFEWLEQDEKLRAGPERVAVESYWQDREAREQAEQERKEKSYRAEMDARRVVFRQIGKEAAKLAMKRWVERDIKRHVQRFKSSATKIQALVRGYQARCKDAHQDCCMCLSHRISPLKTSVGYMCRDCAVLGPHQDLVEEDPWNWHRAEYVDEAPMGNYLYQPCGWCNQDFFAPLYCGDYCSDRCEYYDRNA
jgi:hypothetical protein